MFQGSMVALVTPMTATDEIDYASLARLVEFHIDNGTDALVAVGTTGESATLSFAEHNDVIRRMVELAAGRIPIIAGTGANSTLEALHLTESAAEAGAAACLLVVPYYNKPTQEGLYRHFRTIADRIDIPQILYNVPGRTGCDLLPETVARLADHPRIIGIKEASTLERILILIERCGDRLAIYSGDDPVAAETMLNGGRGVISVTANVAPRLVHELCVAALAGNRSEAERIDAQLRELNKALFVESNPIPVKWAVAQLGLIGPGIRLPLTPLAESQHARVRDAMHLTGIL